MWPRRFTRLQSCNRRCRGSSVQHGSAFAVVVLLHSPSCRPPALECWQEPFVLVAAFIDNTIHNIIHARTTVERKRARCSCADYSARLQTHSRGRATRHTLASSRHYCKAVGELAAPVSNSRSVRGAIERAKPSACSPCGVCAPHTSRRHRVERSDLLFACPSVLYVAALGAKLSVPPLLNNGLTLPTGWQTTRESEAQHCKL